MTSYQFEEETKKDPSWASRLTKTVKVTDFCDMKGSNITHLSPFLHFAGRNLDGCSADFSKCPLLWAAEGTFAGFVDFRGSGLTRIGKLKVNQPNSDGEAANFSCCRALAEASGHFNGSVDFAETGIQKIRDLTILQSDKDGLAADFDGCQKLAIAEGSFPGFVNFDHCSIESIGKLTLTGTPWKTVLDSEETTEAGVVDSIRRKDTFASFLHCRNLKTFPLERFDANPVLLSPETRAAGKKERRKKQKTLLALQAGNTLTI